MALGGSRSIGLSLTGKAKRKRLSRTTVVARNTKERINRAWATVVSEIIEKKNFILDLSCETLYFKLSITSGLYYYNIELMLSTRCNLEYSVRNDIDQIFHPKRFTFETHSSYVNIKETTVQSPASYCYVSSLSFKKRNKTRLI